MRILKFVGGFLLVFILIFFITFGFNLDALRTLWQNHHGIQEGQEWVARIHSLEGLTEYIGAQPEHVSIASFDVSNPDSSISYNEHTPRTMGRLSNLFMIIEYARQVEAGELDPDEPISLEKVARYQLPYMDKSDHEGAVETLRNQKKVSQHETVALKDLVQASVAFNDIAIADFLLYKIGLQKIENLYNTLSLEETELPLPFSGLYITINPEKNDTSAQAHLKDLSELSLDVFRAMVLKSSTRLYKDKAYRDSVANVFDAHVGLNMQFTEQRDALAFFPKTTAAEMSSLMKKLQQNELISSSVSKRVKEILAWPLNNDRLNKDFASYGALYDNRMGMLNGIDFGRSTYSKEPFAQAVFFDELQVGVWFHMSSNLMHQDFEQRMIWDPALRKATIEHITQPDSTIQK